MACLNLTMPNQTGKNGLKAKKIKLPQTNFFLEKQLIKFSCTYWPLSSFSKILRNFLGPIQSYEDVPFVMNKKFLVQSIIITLIYLLAIFVVQNLKNSYSRSRGFFSFFFNCYLAAPRPTLGHYRGGSLTHPMLITCVLHIQPEGHQEDRSEVGSLRSAECLVGFEPGTFRFWSQCLNPLGHFWTQNGPFALNKNFISPFHCVKF